MSQNTLNLLLDTFDEHVLAARRLRTAGLYSAGQWHLAQAHSIERRLKAAGVWS